MITNRILGIGLVVGLHAKAEVFHQRALEEERFRGGVENAKVRWQREGTLLGEKVASLLSLTKLTNKAE